MKDNFGYDMECIIEHLRGIDKRNRDIVFKKDIILIEKHNFNFDHDIEYECIRATQECIIEHLRRIDTAEHSSGRRKSNSKIEKSEEKQLIQKFIKSVIFA